MTPEQWQYIQHLFEHAVELPADAREAFLASISDEAVRQEVRTLLKHAGEGGPVDALVEDVVEPLRASLHRDPYEGRQVGAFRVRQKLGEGGMGVVYLAERADGQFEQNVALKVVRAGLASTRLRDRFLAERRILARLEHPGIARLIDGGFTEDGLPYYAMEFVKGEAIDVYCLSRSLPLRKRVGLFAAVCDVVQFAHQNLIIHRDLKPSNILVTAAGAVKLLDFGIARALTAEGEAEAETRTGLQAMTPEYASPEQIRGGLVSTASDIYSLGVVLYELLTDRRPYEIRTPASPSEVERIVCETEPLRPSTAIEQVIPARGGPNRHETRKRQRSLAGDLDTIALKALEKDPVRRYGSAAAFAADLRRYLRGLPIEARPATMGYRAMKFVRRHRLGVAAAGLLLLSIIAGAAGIYWQAQRAMAERDRAQAERERTEQVAAMMQRLFRLPDPNEALGDTVTARRLLDEGVRRVRIDLETQPELQATMLGELGEVYLNLGLVNAARPLFEEAVTIERRLHPDPHLDLARSLHRLGVLRGQANEFAPADSLLLEALRIREQQLDSLDLDLAATRYARAELLSSMGRYDEASPLFQRALEIQQSRLDAAHPDVRQTMDGYATMLHRQGNFAAAEVLFRDAVAYSRRTSGDRHPATLDYLQDLGRLLHRFNRQYAAAESLYLEARDLATALYGPAHAETASALNDLAQLNRDRGDLDQAERYARESLAAWRTAFGDRHSETAISKFTLATILDYRQQYPEAERLLREALATEKELLGPRHIRIINTMQQLAWLLVDTGKLGEAERLFVESESITRALFGSRHAYMVRARQGIGRVRGAQGRYPEAVALYREALAMRIELHPEGHWRVAQARSLLAGALLDLGHFEEAEQLLDASLPVLVEALGEDDVDTRAALARMARLRREWDG
jgi:serine/threonine-protein kinase